MMLVMLCFFFKLLKKWESEQDAYIVIQVGDYDLLPSSLFPYPCKGQSQASCHISKETSILFDQGLIGGIPAEMWCTRRSAPAGKACRKNIRYLTLKFGG